MGNAKKALAKITDPARAANVTLAEVETALKAAGFASDGGKGSHRVYRHADGRRQIVSAHGAHLPTYIVRQIRALLE
jgi:predicted RNA binding protein YcfA (HicA-like mRNA interferase family)